MGRITSHRTSGERYTGLRLVGAIFTTLGVLLLIGGCLLLAFGLNTLLSGSAVAPAGTTMPSPANAGRFPSVFGGQFSILWSLVLLSSGLQFVAIGALIRLAIHVEENTRVSAQCLERLISRLGPTEQGVGSMFRS